MMRPSAIMCLTVTGWTPMYSAVPSMVAQRRSPVSRDLVLANGKGLPWAQPAPSGFLSATERYQRAAGHSGTLNPGCFATPQPSATNLLFSELAQQGSDLPISSLRRVLVAHGGALAGMPEQRHEFSEGGAGRRREYRAGVS
jgi:hypothetical protein